MMHPVRTSPSRGPPPSQLLPEHTPPPGAFLGGPRPWVPQGRPHLHMHGLSTGGLGPRGACQWALLPRLSCLPQGLERQLSHQRSCGSMVTASGRSGPGHSCPILGQKGTWEGPWGIKEGFPAEGRCWDRRMAGAGGKRTVKRCVMASPGALSLGGSVAATLLLPSASPRPRAVFRSWKPFLMSASRASMTHTSSCLLSPFLTAKAQGPQGRGSRGPQSPASGHSPDRLPPSHPCSLRASPGFPSSPLGLRASSSASCRFLFSALAACSCRSLFSCRADAESVTPALRHLRVPIPPRTARGRGSPPGL